MEIGYWGGGTWLERIFRFGLWGTLGRHDRAIGFCPASEVEAICVLLYLICICVLAGQESLLRGIMGLDMETERSVIMFLQSSRSVFSHSRRKRVWHCDFGKNKAYFTGCIQYFVSYSILISLKNASPDTLSFRSC